MFNNRFTEDNKIIFLAQEWTCTDPDEHQFCRKISDTEYEYIQLKDKELIEGIDPPSMFKGSLAKLEALSEKTRPSDWWQEEIDVTDYDADEIGEYLAPYGGILDNVNDEASRNQLIAECIFETDVVMGEID